VVALCLASEAVIVNMEVSRLSGWGQCDSS
jgi:hypothetical protein